MLCPDTSVIHKHLLMVSLSVSQKMISVFKNIKDIVFCLYHDFKYHAVYSNISSTMLFTPTYQVPCCLHQHFKYHAVYTNISSTMLFTPTFQVPCCTPRYRPLKYQHRIDTHCHQHSIQNLFEPGLDPTFNMVFGRS